MRLRLWLPPCSNRHRTSDWNEANVFLFMFDSDLNAEPVAAADVDETPWMVENQIVEEQPQDEQDAAIVEPASDELVSASLPIDRDLVIQWTRRAIDSAHRRLGSVGHRAAAFCQPQLGDRSQRRSSVDDPALASDQSRCASLAAASSS